MASPVGLGGGTAYRVKIVTVTLFQLTTPSRQVNRSGAEKG
jgi:hypothetical protein